MLIVGFDLGKRKSQICGVDAEGNVVKRTQRRFNTTREGITEAFADLGKCRILIESSTSSEWVARWLERLGHEVIVGDPRFSPMYAQSHKKVKTDKRDALGLAKSLLMGAYQRAHRRSDKSREIQDSLLARAALMRTRTKLINTVRSICESHGVIVPKCRGDAFAKTMLTTTELSAALADALAPLVDSIIAVTTQLVAMDKALDERAERDESTRLLVTARGVGTLTSLAFVAAIDDPTRFPSARHVTSYLGLVPSERNSGDSKRRPGAITKTGDPLVRTYLVEAAFNIMGPRAPDSPLKQWGHAIAAKSGSKLKAAVAVARRLARVLFAMWRDNKPFEAARTKPDSTQPVSTAGEERQAA